MRWLLAVTGVVAVGCGTRLVGSSTDLIASPSELTFEVTAVGQRRTVPLELQNRGRTPLEVSLVTPAPFHAVPSVQVPGGAVVTVEVEFAPTTEGDVSAVVQLGGDVGLQVPVHGVAVPLVCDQPDPCRPVRVENGACVSDVAINGSACATACLPQGRCVDGTCMAAGTAALCDDADPCTADACGPTGCVHPPVVCAAPADPCQAARCEAGQGCVTAPVEDGTSCGPSDCRTASVCLAGACKVVAVPDGASCGPSSPCHDSGRCEAGVCQQGAARALSRRGGFTGRTAIAFDGVVDGQGNLALLHCADATCELVSMTPDGAVRFQVPIPGLTLNELRDARLLWTAGLLVVLHHELLRAYDDQSGHEHWSRELQGRVLLAAAADAHGRVVLASESNDEQGGPELETIDLLHSGARHVVPLSARVTSLVLDARGNRFVTFMPLTLTANMASYSPTGALRFERSLGVAIDTLAGVVGDTLLLASGELRSTIDGAPLSGTRFGVTAGVPSPVANDSHRFVWRAANVAGTWLEGRSMSSSATTFSWQGQHDAAQVSSMQLLDDGSALFAAQLDAGAGAKDVSLVKVAPTGAIELACPVGKGEDDGTFTRWVGATALTNERWAVLVSVDCPSCVHNPPPRLDIYDLRGWRRARTGWTTERGNQHGTFAPQ